MIAYLETVKGLTIYIGSKPVTIPKDHLNYKKIKKALYNEESEETLNSLINISESIEKTFSATEMEVTFRKGQVYYGDKPVHTYVTAKILQFMREGEEPKYLVNFFKKMMQNPSERCRNDLYHFLEYGDMPITPDGDFVAYKVVAADFKDCHTSRFDNSPGKEVTMDKNDCNDDPDQTCSSGLHFCSYEYVPTFMSGDRKIIAIKINPKDVVAIPTDYNQTKGRCCRYLVIEEIGQEDRLPTTVYDTPSIHDNIGDYLEDDGMDDYHYLEDDLEDEDDWYDEEYEDNIETGLSPLDRLKQDCFEIKYCNSLGNGEIFEGFKLADIFKGQSFEEIWKHIITNRFKKVINVLNPLIRVKRRLDKASREKTIVIITKVDGKRLERDRIYTPYANMVEYL